MEPNNQITPDFHIRTNNLGYKIIGMSYVNAINIFGGLGICDHCGQKKHYGYLVPVMGRKWYCTQCHVVWENTGKFYPEDVQYQNMVLEGFIADIKAYEKRRYQTA